MQSLLRYIVYYIFWYKEQISLNKIYECNQIFIINVIPHERYIINYTLSKQNQVCFSDLVVELS